MTCLRSCNARHFAAKITHMTIATNLWRENCRRAIDVVTIAVVIVIVDVGIIEVFASSDKKKTFLINLKEAITCGVNVNFRGIHRLGKPVFFNTLKTLKYIISFENDLATIN